jgi:hypothetical protein
VKSSGFARLEQVLTAIIQIACGSLTTSHLQHLPWLQCEQPDDANGNDMYTVRPDFVILLVPELATLTSSSSFAELMELLETDSGLRHGVIRLTRRLPSGDMQREIEWLGVELTSAVLRAYLQSVPTARFDAAALAPILALVEDEISEVQVRVTEVTPLVYLQLPDDFTSLKLGPNVQIRRVSAREVESWYHQLPHLPGVASLEIATDVYAVIEVHSEVQSGTQSARPKRFDLLLLVDLLRLVTNGRVYVPFTEKLEPRLLALRVGGFSWNGGVHQNSVQFADPVVLSLEASDRLCALWERVHTSPLSPSVKLALRRWSGAAERQAAEDKLIDYWVGLESLFTPDAEQEVKYRARLRMAVVLGSNASNREWIYERAGLSYDWRSALVHGSDTGRLKRLARQGSLADVTGETKAWLRQALLLFVDSAPPDPASIEKRLLQFALPQTGS